MTDKNHEYAKMMMLVVEPCFKGHQKEGQPSFESLMYDEILKKEAKFKESYDNNDPYHMRHVMF